MTRLNKQDYNSLFTEQIVPRIQRLGFVHIEKGDTVDTFELKLNNAALKKVQDKKYFKK